MKPARERHGHPVVADAVTAGAGAAMAEVVATVVVAATVASEEATKVPQKPFESGIGQGWIRTSEGVKPADLQSAPFGHFGTYPLVLRELGVDIGSRFARRK
jgi:hypothetical protein